MPTQPDLKRNLTRTSTPRQVFYHLGELNDALNYALCAGGMFDVTESNYFVKTLLGTRASPAPRSNLPRCSSLDRLFPCEFWEEKSEQPI